MAAGDRVWWGIGNGPVQRAGENTGACRYCHGSGRLQYALRGRWDVCSGCGGTGEAQDGSEPRDPTGARGEFEAWKDVALTLWREKVDRGELLAKDDGGDGVGNVSIGDWAEARARGSDYGYRLQDSPLLGHARDVDEAGEGAEGRHPTPPAAPSDDLHWHRGYATGWADGYEAGTRQRGDR